MRCRPAFVACARLHIGAAFGVDPVDHPAHDPFVVGGQVHPSLLQDRHDVTPSLRARMVGELL
jgi:hypothetical protein